MHRHTLVQPSAPSSALQSFTIDAPTWLIMRQRLLYYLSNGCAIKFPCKWPMPHFILIYGILIEFVSPNWKILLFNVCIAVADQDTFNELVSQWPWSRGGGCLHALDSSQEWMKWGGVDPLGDLLRGRRSPVICLHIMCCVAGGIDKVWTNWWGSHYRIH